MKVRNAVALAAILAVAGCAKAPESIAPAYVSTVPYSTWSCKQLGEESQRLDAAYAGAAAQQKKARGNDIAGVILIGLPSHRCREITSRRKSPS